MGNAASSRERSNKDLCDKFAILKEDERESKAGRSIDKGVNAFLQDASDSDILLLNVGGTKLDVLRGTLTCIPDSLLASKFSGKWDETLLKDQEGRFFLDEDPELFTRLINYLREWDRLIPEEAKGPSLPPCFQDPEKESRFRRMVESFLLRDHLYPFQLIKYGYVSPDPHVFAKDFLGCPIEQKRDTELWTYSLRPMVPHNRRVLSFEVELFPKEAKSIVFILERYIVPGSANEKEEEEEREDGRGPQIEFDLLNADFIVEHPAEFDEPIFSYGLDIGAVSRMEKVTIRCENDGTAWYLDGELLFIVEGRKPTEEFSKMQPSICIEGKVKFSINKVELEP